MDGFNLQSKFQPTGDQPEAIRQIVKGFQEGMKKQTLLGVTGSGKTYTVANIIKALKRPTLVIAHNKTLAAQLCSEFREFFPENAVEFFVSYYDYYQPEAYVFATDTFIEKDSSINDEIDKLRHSATASIFEREDVIIIASVSCIYGLGSPVDYKSMVLSVRKGMHKTREEIMRKLVDIQYMRNDINFVRNTFRVRGDSIEIIPPSSVENAIRIELFGDEIDRITEINCLTGQIIGERTHAIFFPASHYVTPREKIEDAILDIEKELDETIARFQTEGKLIEAQRIEQRTRYDIEMLREVGFCQGIENYSRILSRRPSGSRPYTLIDYFPKDFLVVIDESHVSLPQIRGMYGGDQSRKRNLVDFGFRLPSAMDNRPLNYDEFYGLLDKCLYVSATPSAYEKGESQQIVEQIIRPTGLLDPKIEVRPIEGQIDNLLFEINERVKRHERILITTLTKKMSEDLTTYFKEIGIAVRYMHSDIDTMERMEIIRDLRLGNFDVLIGINLLREGLDLPEVSLVVILDADKEGFLRSGTALVQTIGRAARHLNGQVIMYADKMTDSMKLAISETNRRREIQNQYNITHGIDPQSIIKAVYARIEATVAAEEVDLYDAKKLKALKNPNEIFEMIHQLEEEMKTLAKNLQFERAAELRDIITALKKKI